MVLEQAHATTITVGQSKDEDTGVINQRLIINLLIVVQVHDSTAK